ncbi:MAG TPA: hypothetical protein VFW40_06990 [Capsulimonadaceae bacterium]|nr:hypothetical protein [Capsulimonadaceae bacterium]
MKTTLQAIALYLFVAALFVLSPRIGSASFSHLGARTVLGSSQRVCGAPVTAWARVGADNRVLAAGVTIPLSVMQNPPEKPGNGPVGAVAVVRFPKIVRDTTYFNHFEMQWNPHGHPPACCFGLPHFDFHFYGIPASEEWTFKFRDPKAPAADRMPAGYVYPGADQCVPNMGVHAVRPGDINPKHAFIVNMVAGFYDGQMNFIEPMVTREYLLNKQNFTLPVPMPKVLGRHTLYPTRFQGIYNKKAKSYELIFSGFREMN